MGYDFDLDERSIQSLYRRLIAMGYSKVEASNLIANLMGLGPLEKGWTLKELQRLQFLAYLDKTNKLGS